MIEITYIMGEWDMNSNANKGRISVLVNEAVKNYAAADKNHIYVEVGTSLISMGLEADGNMESKCLLKPQESFNSRKVFVNTISGEIPAENAKRIGKDFWEIFKEKAVYYICEDGYIVKLIQNGKVNAALESIITSVLIPMGISGLWIPAVATIALGVLILLLKAGIESVCNLNDA